MKRLRKLSEKQVFKLHCDSSNRIQKDNESKHRSDLKYAEYERLDSLGVDYVEDNIFYLHPDFYERANTVFYRVSND